MHSISSDGPVLIVIEGLLCYLPGDKVIKLLKSLCQNFRVGEILFECITPTALRALNRRKPIESIIDLGVEFYWAVDHPETLEHIDPALNLVESVRLAEAPGVEKAPLGYRALMYVLSWTPKSRDSARFLRFRFGDLREL
jgi:O-methyltransferase involved in polyketide biosynthesis